MRRLIILVAFLAILVVVGFMGYKLISSLDHDKKVIDAQRSQESLILDGITKEDLFKVIDTNSLKLYSQEYEPEFVNDMGEKVKIKDFLETSNCTIDCIHKYSAPIITYENGNIKVYEFSVENEKKYLVECSNHKDYFIGKDYKKLRKLC